MEQIGNLDFVGLEITFTLLIPGIFAAAFLAGKLAFRIEDGEDELSVIGIIWLVLTFIFSYLAFVIISLSVTGIQWLLA
ncbi:hypothetical protein [Neolewinella persica]|uniref:hypothetical protein n=1 Tax=Neolewinella persica TaxID=70998 RepID=UPI00036B8A57|nr:hypothetical protein [Neolewinella persica]